MLHKLTIVMSSFTKITGLITILLAIISPIYPLLYATLFLIFVDTLTGIMAYYYKNNIHFRFWKWSSWKHIKSSKLGLSINKSLVYMLLIICGFVIDTFVFKNDTRLFTHALAGSVVFRELISVIENVGIITSENLTKTVLNFFKFGFKKSFEQGLSDNIEEK